MSIKSIADRAITAEALCKSLQKEFPFLKWTWDGRFEAHLAEVAIEDAQKVSEFLRAQFAAHFDKKSLKTAPEEIRAAVESSGGLESGQNYYTSEDTGDAFLYGAWWPWGNGKVISLRVGVKINLEKIAEQLPPFQDFPKWISHS